MKRLIVASFILFAACSKDTASLYNTHNTGKLSVEFDNIAGASDLQLNTGNYTNSSGEKFTVTKLKYYVSNFVLTREDGSEYTIPQDSAYFLVDESIAGSNRPSLTVPEGAYTKLRFILGVDSLRNTMDISRRTGVLDPVGPASDMYWGWNSGYIFFKMEGNSTAAAGGSYGYHIGGFGGYTTPTVNNLRVINLDLSARGTAKVTAARSANIHLLVDVLKLLNGISFAGVSQVHSPAGGVVLAANAGAMFVHDHTENE